MREKNIELYVYVFQFECAHAGMRLPGSGHSESNAKLNGCAKYVSMIQVKPLREGVSVREDAHRLNSHKTALIHPSFS